MATSFGRDIRLQGALDGEDTDYGLLTVSGEMQLWRILAIGAGVSRLVLLGPNGKKEAEVRREKNEQSLRLSNLLLAPGQHVIGVMGKDARYVLQAIPLGPPKPGDEIEPNDDEAHALAIAPGEQRKGSLDHPGDVDVYSFYLAAEQRISLTLAAPAETVMRASLGWSDVQTRVAQFETPAAGERTVVWDGLLPPPFDWPTDLEPNDEPWQARPVPPHLRISGTLFQSDRDWFALPELPRETKLTVVPKLGDRTLSLKVVRVAAGPYPPGASVSTTSVADLAFDQASGTYSAQLPAGRDLVLQVSGAIDAYDLALTFESGPTPVPLRPLSVDAHLNFAESAVAAFRPEAQHIEGELVLSNRGSERLALTLETFVDDERWRVLPQRTGFDLAAGETASIPVAVEVSPDAWDQRSVRVAVAARDTVGATVSAEAVIQPRVDAPAVQSHPFSPLPEAMLGGFNAASAALGAQSLDNHPTLIDGLVNDGASAWLDSGQTATIKLAGDEPVPLIGVIVNLQGVPDLVDRLRRFEIETSDDGKTFTKVLSGTLSPRAVEQAFLFANPVRPRFLRLVPVEAQGGPKAGRFRLGELKAIATTEWMPKGASFDLMMPELGGHVIWAAPQPESPLTGESAA